MINSWKLSIRLKNGRERRTCDIASPLPQLARWTPQILKETRPEGFSMPIDVEKVRITIGTTKIDSVEHESTTSHGDPVVVRCAKTNRTLQLVLQLLFLPSMLYTSTAGYAT